MHIGIPQIIYIVLLALGSGLAIAKFGQQKQDKYGWYEVIVGPMLVSGLLYWGGFFG